MFVVTFTVAAALAVTLGRRALAKNQTKDNCYTEHPLC
jgi:hypothetical protein